MRDHSQVFPLLGETSGSIYPLARAVMRPLFEEYFSEQRFYQPVFIAYQLSPKILTETLYRKRAPYNNPQAICENLADAAKAGYLEGEDGGGYRISQQGKTAIELVHKRFYDQINEVNLLSAAKLGSLVELLRKLVDAAGRAEFSSGVFSLELVQAGHPEVKPGTLAEVDQLLDDLNAFRDDAHIAAWIPTGVSGHVWEVLTFIWNGEAKSAAELVEKLPYRSYLEDEFQETLDTLVQLGWINKEEDGYTATPEGARIREEAEERTNQNYFGPWQALSDQELETLGDLLQELKEINLKLMDE